jgi:two-component system, cell cycle response regulator
MHSNQELPNILCIDDEIGILESLERTLRRRFHVFTATNSSDAMEIINNNKNISVIVCDHLLGQEKGVEFLTQTMQLLPLASRVLLSGQVDMKSLESAINSARIHKFILKPWENDQLLLHIIEAHKIHKRLIEQEQLKILSITDPITQLTNHRFFQEKLRIEWDKYLKSNKPISLIMIDVDHFKKFNDRFGHPEGDKFLFHIAQTINESLTASANLSRYGGEEFSVILPNTNSPEALLIAEKIRHAILESSFQDYPLSVSLGVATAPEHASSVDELIISADQSLFQAKRRGRNQTVVGLSFSR